MKIIVDCLPDHPSECLFSYHNCERGWMCKLYKTKEKDFVKLKMYLEVPKCNIKNCPYLREESWFGVSI